MVGRVECLPAGLRPDPNQNANSNPQKQLHPPGSWLGNKSYPPHPTTSKARGQTIPLASL